MAGDLLGKRVAILAADGVERVELELPRGALYGAGAACDVLAPHTGEIQARQFDLVSAGTLAVDRQVNYASVSDYDALLLPGGTVNPDTLRINADAVEFVKACVAAHLPIAAICHGPWTLVEANAVTDRRMTSWPSLRTELRCAGANWVDEEVVVDGNLVTSRKPDDLDAFNAAMIEEFARGDEEDADEE
jgi:protease I